MRRAMARMPRVIGRPRAGEADAYYFRYIDRVSGDDPLAVLEPQLEETVAFLSPISEERSLHRYDADKWTMRQVVNHVNDCERSSSSEPSGSREASTARCRASISTPPRTPRGPTRSPGRATSRSSGASGWRRSLSSGT